MIWRAQSWSRPLSISWMVEKWTKYDWYSITQDIWFLGLIPSHLYPTKTHFFYLPTHSTQTGLCCLCSCSFYLRISNCFLVSYFQQLTENVYLTSIRQPIFIYSFIIFFYAMILHTHSDDAVDHLFQFSILFPTASTFRKKHTKVKRGHSCWNFLYF